jgi:hypothetical protein
MLEVVNAFGSCMTTALPLHNDLYTTLVVLNGLQTRSVLSSGNE